MAFVEFNDVRKVYKMGEVEVAAADGMTFSAEAGEFVVVVAPRGRERPSASDAVAPGGEADEDD